MFDLKTKVTFTTMPRMNMPAPSLARLLSLVLVVAACGDGGGGGGSDDDSDTEDAGPGGDGDGDGDGDGEACQPAEVPCVDQSISGLMLRDTKSGGAIAEEGDGDAFVSHVDATAGGIMITDGYTYARFGEKGLERLDLSDEEAFESTDWDIAFRRYVIRLNSGVSGPSCVQGARVPGDDGFDALDGVPDNLSFFAEQYFTEGSCEFVPDASGIMAPSTVLGSFWTYPGCVKMTGNVYVVRLASGKHVKLEVLSYYEPSFQETCDTMNTVQMGNNGAGNVRVKWAWLD
jgi:hypothetical protein